MHRIAIIDDDKDIRMYLDIYLSEFYSVSCFEKSKDALREMENNPPDLLIMDISMPDISGIEMLKIIRGHPKLHKIPVIALTGHGLEEDRIKFLEQGFNGYISKPISSETEFLATINQLLSSKK